MDSEAENTFIASMMAECLMDEHGNILTAQGHIYQVEDWMSLVPMIGEPRETINAIMDECHELIKKYKNINLISDPYHELIKELNQED